jgi:uncharacterized protein YkwD
MIFRTIARLMAMIALITITANTADAGRCRRARQVACQPAACAGPQAAYAPMGYSTPQAPVVTATPASGDVYGFTVWLNGVRAQHGLGAVALDGQLQADAAANSSRGFGHHWFGSARRQNAGMGALGTVQVMWLQSPAHAAALLDPTITAYGLACVGNVWTFSAR